MNVEFCMGTASYHSVYTPGTNDPSIDQTPVGTHGSCRWCSENVVLILNPDTYIPESWLPYGVWITELHIVEWP